MKVGRLRGWRWRAGMEGEVGARGLPPRHPPPNANPERVEKRTGRDGMPRDGGGADKARLAARRRADARRRNGPEPQTGPKERLAGTNTSAWRYRSRPWRLVHEW